MCVYVFECAVNHVPSDERVLIVALLSLWLHFVSISMQKCYCYALLISRTEPA